MTKTRRGNMFFFFGITNSKPQFIWRLKMVSPWEKVFIKSSSQVSLLPLTQLLHVHLIPGQSSFLDWICYDIVCFPHYYLELDLKYSWGTGGAGLQHRSLIRDPEGNGWHCKHLNRLNNALQWLTSHPVEGFGYKTRKEVLAKWASSSMPGQKSKLAARFTSVSRTWWFSGQSSLWTARRNPAKCWGIEELSWWCKTICSSRPTHTLHLLHLRSWQNQKHWWSAPLPMSWNWCDP